MSKTFCLLNHRLTEKQLVELSAKLGSSNIVYPPDFVSHTWEQLPVSDTLENLPLLEVTGWLQKEHAVPGDYLIVQGEFGYTFALVDYALKKGLIPLHAVTRRIEKEERDGEVIRRHYVFEHVCFRRYVYFNALVNEE